MDFGCGTGLLTEKISPIAKSIFTVDLIQKTDELKFSFDLIVASFVCIFLPNYVETLKLFYSLLPPNGYFVQWNWLKTQNPDDNGMSIKQ